MQPAPQQPVQASGWSAIWTSLTRTLQDYGCLSRGDGRLRGARSALLPEGQQLLPESQQAVPTPRGVDPERMPHERSADPAAPEKPAAQPAAAEVTAPAAEKPTEEPAAAEVTAPVAEKPAAAEVAAPVAEKPAEEPTAAEVAAPVAEKPAEEPAAAEVAAPVAEKPAAPVVEAEKGKEQEEQTDSAPDTYRSGAAAESMEGAVEEGSREDGAAAAGKKKKKRGSKWAGPSKKVAEGELHPKAQMMVNRLGENETHSPELAAWLTDNLRVLAMEAWKATSDNYGNVARLSDCIAVRDHARFAVAMGMSDEEAKTAADKMIRLELDFSGGKNAGAAKTLKEVPRPKWAAEGQAVGWK